MTNILGSYVSVCKRTTEPRLKLGYKTMSAKEKAMGSQAREILAHNVRTRMNARYKSMPTENARIIKLASASGVSRPTIQRILRCTHATTVDMIEDLARGLRCETHELLKESDPTAD